MKISKVAVVTLMLINGAVIAIAQPKPNKATAAQMATLKKQADDMAAAMMQQNFVQMLHFTYPNIVQQLGGQDKALKKLEETMGQMQSQGVAFKSVTIGDIGEIVPSHGDLYSVVPDVLQLSVNGTIITKGSSLLAISHNKGVRWYFVDTAPFKHQNLKKMFPTYPPGLVIPETGKTGF